MAEVKFGRRQLDNPTPKGVAFTLNVIMAISTALAGWINTVDFIPARPSSIIAAILSLVVLVCMALKPFYGVETAQQNIPVEDVGEMEEKTKP